VRVTEKDLEQAAMRVGLSTSQASALWQALSGKSEVESRFEPAHVGYFFGALLVIGAMGWFMTEGWDSFTGWQLAAISLGYAAVFLLVGRRLWRTARFKVPAGLLITMAVCMTPLAVYGIERQLHLWPAEFPGSYTRFHPLIHASWVIMEVATVAAGTIALRFFRFPFLTAPIAYALWYMSMDATALMFGRSWHWHDLCLISAVFGAIMLLVAYWVDGKTELDFSFWGYLFGLLTFTGGLSAIESGNEWAKFGYMLIHLLFVLVSLLLHRKVFLVFGAFGVFGYLCNEAYTHFRHSVGFPFVLTIIGLALIYLAMKYHKNEDLLESRIRAISQ
jgi:hypothetical protein